MTKGNFKIGRLSKFSLWLVLPLLGSCYYFFSLISESDFSSPYLNDWIFLNLIVCIFWASITLSFVLSISIYYEIKAGVSENLSKPNTEINKSIEYSKRLFIIGYEIFNFAIIATPIYIIGWIIFYFICPFIEIITNNKTYTTVISTIIIVVIFDLISRKARETRIGKLVRSLYSDCIFLTKKFKGIFLVYVVILTLIFPFFCYRYEITIDNDTLKQSKDSTISIDIMLSGMTSSSNYYNHAESYILSNINEKKIPLDFIKVGKMKFRSIKDVKDLPKGTYNIVSSYKRQLMFFKWKISREKIFQII